MVECQGVGVLPAGCPPEVMNVQTIWLRVLRDGAPLDVVVDVPVAGVTGLQRMGRLAGRVRPRPRPRAQRAEDVSAPRRGSCETFQ